MTSTEEDRPYTPAPLRVDYRSVSTYDETVKFVELSHLKLDDSQAKKGCVIKAPMGTGKTTCISSYLNTLPANTRVLVIGARRTFDEGITTDLNSKVNGDKFVCYLGKKCIQGFHRLVVQWESLWKLDAVDIYFDVIVVDESESMLVQSVSRDTNGNNLKKNQDVFVRLITMKKCFRVFFMDAFLSCNSIEVLRGLNIPFHYHNYKRLPVERRAIQYNTFNFKTVPGMSAIELKKSEYMVWVSELINLLVEGKRIYTFISSIKKARALEATVKEACKKYPSLKHLSMLVYGGDVKSDLSNPRKDWASANLVITTCSITVGINYDFAPDNHPEFMFDTVFIYASACSQNLVRDVFQASMRVRHLKDNVLHFFIDPTARGCDQYLPSKLITERNGLRESDANEILTDNSLETIQTTALWRGVEDRIHVEMNHNGRLFEKIFTYYLNLNNYKVELVETEEAGALHDLVELDDKPIAYKDVPEVVMSQVKELERRDRCFDLNVPKLTPLERATVLRYSFDRSLETTSDERRSEIWDLLHGDLGMEKFLNIQYELGLASGAITIKDALCEGKWDKAVELGMTEKFDKQREMRAVVMMEFAKLFGVSHTLVEQKITNEKFEAVIKLAGWASLQEKARTAFDRFNLRRGDEPVKKEQAKKPVKKPGKKEPEERPYTLYSKCVKTWTGSEFKRDPNVRKMVNGVSSNLAGYTLKPIDAGLYKDVKPRVSKSSERGMEEERKEREME